MRTSPKGRSTPPVATARLVVVFFAATIFFPVHAEDAALGDVMGSSTELGADDESEPAETVLDEEPGGRRAVHVSFAGACASEDSAARLRSELALRLDLPVDLVPSNEAADLRWEEQGEGCGLVFSAGGEPFFVPLDEEASPEQLRSAASRAAFLLDSARLAVGPEPQVLAPPALEPEDEETSEEPEPEHKQLGEVPDPLTEEPDQAALEADPADDELVDDEPRRAPEPARATIRGVSATGLVNFVDPQTDVDGFQIAGLANLNRGHTKGVQLAGIGNWAGGGMEGLQAAWIANYAGQDSVIFQVSNVNIAEAASGAQLGLVNVAGRLDGAQVGVLNLAADVDYPVGVFNIVREQPLLVTASVSTDSFVTLGLRHGGRRLRYSYLAGYHRESPWPFAVGAGFSLFRPGRVFVLSLEGHSWQILGFSPLGFSSLRIASLQEFRLLGGLRFGRRFEIHFGPTLKLLSTEPLLVPYPIPDRSFSFSVGSGERIWAWPELHLALVF